MFAFMGISPLSMVLIGVVAILLFGSKLPEVARTLGQSYNQLKRSLADLQSQFNIDDFTAPPTQSSQTVDDFDEPERKEPIAPKFTPPPAPKED